MRYLAQIRRLERLYPAPPIETIVRWGDKNSKPMEIFSTLGWRIFYDENGVFTKVGDVPDEYTADLLEPPPPPPDPQSTD
jgi:hypothetical protein